jgi:tubulin polyglutamylase TTLL5
MPKTWEITRKDNMYRNLLRMQELFGTSNFDFVPKTYILPADAFDLAREMQNESYWIVKPVASSQGRGIFLTNRYADVPKGHYIVSRYLDNPLLIDGYKFDLRIYVAITSINPLRIYMYEEGLTRFATEKYGNTN